MHFTLALLHRHLLADLGSLRLTLARLVVQPAVYLYVFGYVVGGMLAGGNGPGYAAVMGPGIVAIAIMTAPFGAVGGTLVSGYYFRTLEGWLLAPVSLRQLLVAKVVSGVLYGTLSATIVALLVWAILGLRPEGLLLPLALAVGGSAFFSLLSLVVLLLPATPDRGQELFSFLLMPMTFFGCTFYSHAMLGPPFSQLALLLPTTYLAEGLRGAYDPSQPHLATGAILLGLAAAVVLLAPLAAWSFRRRLGDYLW
ncbi:ABC transporter permease [Thioalbus denitrificans]|uniref:Transport permease protein n=1 Tax=Thioalbus denitrificans TaxID=547122 RepID=A0A369BXB3_9GAMM|nr:ABC transporter permease [Thioalbus denitrificans]RCX26330.1 ABC-2 type transport system permease protein [Thioalbus denitrificans]